MIACGLLLALALPASAQVAPALPAEPAPASPVTPSNLDDVFRRFTSGQLMIPTLKEVQAEQLQRDLARAPEDGDGALPGPQTGAGLALFSAPPMNGVRRETTERVDVAVSRPARRVELGVGYSLEDVNIGNRHIEGGTSWYGLAQIDLSKVPLARKLFHSPTAVHSEVVLQDDHVSVDQDDYTVDFLKHPH
ncbi:MAG TPA: hypothetical protein VH309_12860 [Elusimicrobiota bacterium]|jgi:hypothetical protein|nr:hypothetical protein [Elusimicrobiota bacterium]